MTVDEEGSGSGSGSEGIQAMAMATTLDFSVSYIDLPYTVASTYMGRNRVEEVGYRAACGKTFSLPLFPCNLKMKLETDLLTENTNLEINTDRRSFILGESVNEIKTEKTYKSEFILLSRIAVSVRIRSIILKNEKEAAVIKLHSLNLLQEKCREKKQQSRKRYIKLV